MTITTAPITGRTGLGWLEGHLRDRGRHRPAARRRAAFRDVVTGIRARALTMAQKSRNTVFHWSAMGCLVTAGFHVATALGWLVAGLALIWTQHLSE